MENGQGRAFHAAEWAALGSFAVWAGAILAGRSGPHLTDYSNWAYQGELLARHMRGIPDSGHWLKTYPVPNSAATLGVGFFALVLSGLWAAKVWLTVQLAVSYASLRHLARTVGADWAVWGIAPAGVFFGVSWWYGFVNFELGICWAMLTASFLLRRVRENLGSDWVLGMLLVAAFFTHMISFCFCGLLVVSYAWQTRRFRIVWQLVPSCLLTIWYVLGRYLIAGNADGETGQIATVKDYSAAFWAFKVNSYLKSLGYVNPVKPSGSLVLTLCGKLGFAGLLAVDLAMAVLVGWCLAWAVRRAYRDRAAERFAWTAALLLLPLYLLIPGNALGISDPGSRLLQVGLGLAVVLMCRRPSVALRGAAVCGVVLAAASLAMFFRIAFGVPVVGTERGFPHAVVEFAHAPLLDEDVYWWALDHGDYRQRVFPSGMFLNR